MAVAVINNVDHHLLTLCAAPQTSEQATSTVQVILQYREVSFTDLQFTKLQTRVDVGRSGSSVLWSPPRSSAVCFWLRSPTHRQLETLSCQSTPTESLPHPSAMLSEGLMWNTCMWMFGGVTDSTFDPEIDPDLETVDNFLEGRSLCSQPSELTRNTVGLILQ